MAKGRVDSAPGGASSRSTASPSDGVMAFAEQQESVDPGGKGGPPFLSEAEAIRRYGGLSSVCVEPVSTGEEQLAKDCDIYQESMLHVRMRMAVMLSMAIVVVVRMACISRLSMIVY